MRNPSTPAVFPYVPCQLSCATNSLRLLDADPDQPHGDSANGNNGHDDDLVTPRPLNEDEKLSLAVDRLAGNEKLLGALAWRLGIPLADVRPDGREPPLARDRGGEDEEELDENREQIEVRRRCTRDPEQLSCD